MNYLENCNIGPARFVLSAWTTVPAAVDLALNGIDKPAKSSGSGRVPRWITVGNAGTTTGLVGTDFKGNAVAWTPAELVAMNYTVYVQMRTLGITSDATYVKAYY